MKKHKTAQRSVVGFFLRLKNRFADSSLTFSIPQKNVGFLFLTTLLIFIPLIVLTPFPVFAADNVMVSSEMPQEAFGERKNISGQVGASNQEGLALVIKTDSAETEREMWLPFAVGARYNGYNDASDIKQGDRVSIVYEEGGGKRLLREVTFNQRAPEAAPVAEDIVAPETDAVDAEAAQ